MSKPKLTEKGTPCSPKWDADWIGEVEALEYKAGRRCCGAKCPDGEPCLLQSKHKNGRCRFHGGAKGIGAPEGNMNARIHGLYSRRIQQCGEHCPMWKSCPMAGQDVLELPEKKRPECTYEREEYDMLSELDNPLTPSMVRSSSRNNRPNPLQAQIVMLRENLKTLHILMTRCSTALRHVPITQETTMQSDTYYMAASKPHAYIQALNSITREFRQTLRLYQEMINVNGIPEL